MELKNIGSRVVSYHVEVELAPHNLRAIDLRRQNRFALIVGTCQKIAEGINNAASAPANDGARILWKIASIILGIVAPPIELITR